MITQFVPASLLQKLFAHDDERELVQKALQAIEQAGGKGFLVGGAVRDLLIDSPIKDVDIEVYGLSLESLGQALQKFGIVNYIGKSFGVLRWEHSTIDWAVPRRDSAGRKPQVAFDPSMSMSDALRRRDLTINAMAINLATGELVDPFGGCQDLKNRTARSPDSRFFTEDPLRFYRVMQFIARFQLTPDAELNRVCATMDISSVSSERIEAEFDKLFLLASIPSSGIRWINGLNRLSEVLPELALTVGILQQIDWHPEGDVFEHSMQALDAAADCLYPDDTCKLILLSAALCHDLGKAVSTHIREGRIRSTGHDRAGVALAKSLMGRITHNKKRIATVCKLVRHHMAPLIFIRDHASDAAYRRLAAKLSPDATCAMLALLAEADKRGRNPARGVPLPGPISGVVQFKERAEAVGVLCEPLPPVLAGTDLLDIFKPGPCLGLALDRAYEMQINENITDKDTLKKRLMGSNKKAR